MSLVNDLLEDFHRRRVSPEGGPNSPLEGVEVSGRRLIDDDRVPGVASREPRAWVSIVLVALTCVMVVGIEIGTRLVPATDASRTPDVSAKPPFALPEIETPRPAAGYSHSNVSPGIAPSAPSSPTGARSSVVHDLAELTGIDVEPSGGYTRVRLHLTRERDYWIQGDPADGEVEVVITNARLSGAFSPLSFEGSGLTLRETHNTSIGLHLVLAVKSSSRIQSQFVDDGSRSQLVLDLMPASVTNPHGAEEAETPLASLPLPREVVEATRNDDWGVISQTRPAALEAVSQAQQSLHRARNLVARERSGEAVAEYIRALTLDSDLHAAREGVVALLVETGEFAAAERHLADGLARSPAHSAYTLLRAQLLAAMNQTDRAIAILESLPTPQHRRSDALNLLAALYQQKGEYARAETLFRDAVQIAPYEARLWMGLGISLEGQSRKTEALAVYRQAESLADFETGPRRWLRSRIRDLATVE